MEKEKNGFLTVDELYRLPLGFGCNDLFLKTDEAIYLEAPEGTNDEEALSDKYLLAEWLEVAAETEDKNGLNCGKLLSLTVGGDSTCKLWVMPMKMLANNVDGVIEHLLDMGVAINQNHKNYKSLLATYLGTTKSRNRLYCKGNCDGKCMWAGPNVETCLTPNPQLVDNLQLVESQ